MTNEELRDLILEGKKKGFICFRTEEGVQTCNIEDFVKQPLEGMLYDLNRDYVTIMTFLDNPKWTNDFALTLLLEHYYEENKKLKAKIAELEKSGE